jgi:hypothetical protein
MPSWLVSIYFAPRGKEWLGDAEDRERKELVFSIVGAGAPCLFTSGFDCERA